MSNQENGSCCNQEMIKGIVALSVGVVCIALAYKIILYAILFMTGLTLVYYGLAMLKMDQITNWVDSKIKKIRDMIPNSKK